MLSVPVEASPRLSEATSSTPQNPTPFRWTKVRALAAQLLAEDQLTDEQIADRCKVNRWTIGVWKKHPDFDARVQQIVTDAAAALKGEGLKRKENLIAEAEWRHGILKRVLEERQSDPLVQHVPGGSTGAIVPEPMLVKVYEADPAQLQQLADALGVDIGAFADSIGDGLVAVPRESKLVYKYSIDKTPFDAMLAIEKQIAQLTGQLTEKREVTGRNGGPIEFSVTDLVKLAGEDA